MKWHGFETGSAVHFAALITCLAATLAVVIPARRRRSGPQSAHRRIIVGLCLGSWVVTVAYGLHPRIFAWDFSLPLQFCNFANLFGAAAVGWRNRHAATLLFFWGLILCPWAILTPSLTQGPATLWFWVFWIYHLCIPISLAWTIAVDGYRPTGRDLGFALAITAGYLLMLFILNAMTGWNYGFVGEGMPENPSPVDLLGPYPWRVLLMAAIGTILFASLYFLFRKKPVPPSA